MGVGSKRLTDLFVGEYDYKFAWPFKEYCH